MICTIPPLTTAAAVVSAIPGITIIAAGAAGAALVNVRRVALGGGGDDIGSIGPCVVHVKIRTPEVRAKKRREEHTLASAAELALGLAEAI